MAETDVIYEDNSLRALMSGGSSTRHVKAATIPKLMDLLVEGVISTEVGEALVQCHTLQCSSYRFACSLLAKLDQIKDDEDLARAKLRVIELLRKLVNELLLSNPESKAVEKIKQYLTTEAGREYYALGLVNKINFRRKDGWQIHIPEGSTTSLLPPDAEVTSLTQVPASELARQLTLLMSKSFTQLRPREYANFLRGEASLFDLIYTHKLRDSPKKKMPNLLRMVAHFCGLVHWLRREISNSLDRIATRTATLKYLFDFAENLHDVRNIHALGAVVLVLQPHMTELQQILSEAEGERMKELTLLFCASETDTLQTKFEFSHSTRRGRNFLYSTQVACLPFLGTYLHAMQIIQATEASFEEEANLKEKGMANLQKIERFHLVVKMLQTYQYRLYDYQQVNSVRKFIKRNIRWGLRALELRPLSHLCREAIWRNGNEWRGKKLPTDLTDFLSQHKVRLGDVLSVLSSL